ncbi:MAG TPA: aldehyde dehydrogenase family protein [Blastocatellia bacterium]|nr:aldehyde dehydrogenase family protein [Blastocatellia bacterium]
MASDKDLESVQQARDLVAAAYEAQKRLAGFDQARIDKICEAMSTAALAEADRLGQLAHEETGYGIPSDKAIKNRFAAGDVHAFFRNMRTVGIVRQTETIFEVASPRGVVAAIIPSTNPTSTALFKCLISIKSRNGVVLSPHPSAARCIAESARIVSEAAVAAGAPPGIIGWMSVATIEGTDALMKSKRTAVILATGGIGLVRAAYSSGKPAFGVGPGNVPAFVDASADVSKAARDILTGKCFDNGTICASEQSVVADRRIDGELRAALESFGAHFLTADEADKLTRVVATATNTLNPKIVGRSAAHIAELAGISIPSGVRCLIAEVAGVGRDYPLSMEKLSPILTYYTADGVEAGVDLCEKVLRYGGMGHTASIHSRTRENVEKFGERIPASRIVVNTPSTHGAIGFSTDLEPSMTLGCGSWGGNVTSDNISPLHLMDIKRIAYETREVVPETATQAAAPPRPLPRPPIAASAAAPAAPVNISSLVDRFLAERAASGAPVFAQPAAAPAPPAAPTEVPKTAATAPSPAVPAEFVCEDDVRRAIDEGRKIPVGAKTIITPAARELGDAREVFARR